ncbi:ATP-binding protein [Paludisphaera borealis]|uniref:ATP-binding protein n=1 Tax=Paludisphaera borealis TaxID=1387353 RepID=UPI001F246ACB|nr:ATP-binding protein [Paludisphaera borealis]
MQDLPALVDREFPEATTPDQMRRESDTHDSLAAAQAYVFVGRLDEMDHLDAHADGVGPPLVVTGPPGVGKSALLAA